MNSDIFEGGFRRLPEQNLAGASRHSRKEDFLQKIQFERITRQLDLKKNGCAIKIQALARGFITRRRVKHFQEMSLLAYFHNAQHRDLFFRELDVYLALCCQINSFDSSDVLVWLSKQVMNSHREIIRHLTIYNSIWLWRVRWFLNIHCRRIIAVLEDYSTSGNSQNLLISLQILDTFTNYNVFNFTVGASAPFCLKSVLIYIAKNGYFDAAYHILHTCEFHFGNDGSTSSSFTQSLIRRSLELIDSDDMNYGMVVTQQLCKHFLTDQTSSLTKSYIFPIFLAFEKEAVQCFIESIVLGGIESSTSCLFILIEFIKKGYQCHSKNSVAALTILLRQICLSGLKISHGYIVSIRTANEIDDVPEVDDEANDDNVNGDDDGTSLSDLVENPIYSLNFELLQDSLDYLKNNDFAMETLKYLDSIYSEDSLVQFSKFIYLLISYSFKQFKILCSVSVYPIIYKDLWEMMSAINRVSLDGQRIPLLYLVTRGFFLTPEEAELFYPLLITFCVLFKRYICMLHNSEIKAEHSDSNYFSISKVTEIICKLKDIAVTLLNNGLPDTPVAISEEYRNCNNFAMKRLFYVAADLLRILNSREIGFDQACWISKRVYVPHNLSVLNEYFNTTRPALFDETSAPGSFVLSKSMGKHFIILRDLYFTISANFRFGLLQNLFSFYKNEFQNPNEFIQESAYVKIRRDYIYEDAFEKLSPCEVPEIRINIRIQLTSAMGYEEAGIDGGGVFKEFMSEFLKSAFDPNRGFFLLNGNNELYPNPDVEILYPNYKAHYLFIGRMLAKALYENILIELPLAECFLSHIIKKDQDVNIHDLHSMDPELFKNLVSLRSFDGDFGCLGLNYTAVSDLYGQTKVTELINGGENIPVNRLNKVDYIFTIADFKLNTQLKWQCFYFKQGIDSVFPMFWLSIFSPKELQRVIFCSDSPINVDDLKNNCSYSGGYTHSHPNIIRFWKVFTQFDDAEKKLLLKFVTSCGRQPLLGFKELDPVFNIHLVEGSDHLPTSSTCMNQLKLPIFQDERIMKEKLLYAIKSQAGFDLC